MNMPPDEEYALSGGFLFPYPHCDSWQRRHTTTP